LLKEHAEYDRKHPTEAESLLWQYLKADQQQNDKQRTEWLESRGYRVIRFTNEELFRNINKVLETIKEKLYE